jgi:hypothetical protein
MMFNFHGYTLSWSEGPLVLSVALLLLTLIVVVWAKKGWARLGAVTILLFLLYDVALLKPVPGEAPKTLVVLEDKSASADHTAQSVWLETLKKAVGERATLKILPLPQSDQGTLVIPPLKQALQSVPADRLAGAVIISDTLWHDPEADITSLKTEVPVHVLSTFRSGPDRSVTLEKTSAYQLVGKPFSVAVTVRDTTQPGGAEIPLNMYQGDTQTTHNVRNGEKTEISLNTEHPGRTTLIFATPPLAQEAHLQNNAAVFTLTVFRDRWRVMMVSGSPHPSTRAFRSLFKQDPNIDLVHFSILRRMDSMDFTPPDEMALIPFPVDELFLNRIDDFDLIVMDRYANLGLLQPIHIQSLRSFIQRGGAFVIMTGAEGLKDDSLFNALKDIMAIKAYPQTYPDVPFTPTLGEDHPITQPFVKQTLPLLRGSLPLPLAERAELLMETPEKTPVITLWRETPQHGRMAWIATDDVWMWRRQAGEAGAAPPFNPLMRRLMHWLLREPDLEAPPMICQQDKGVLACTPKNKNSKDNVELYRPDDTWQPWSADADGVYRMPLDRSGLWAVRADHTLIPIAFDMGPPAEWKPVTPSGETLAAHHGGREVTDPEKPLTVVFGGTLADNFASDTLVFNQPTAYALGRSDPWPWMGPLLAGVMGVFLLLGWRR